MSNPKVSQKTITSLTIKGEYDKDGTIKTDDGVFDVLALLSMFHNFDIKLNCKTEIVEDEE